MTTNSDPQPEGGDRERELNAMAELVRGSFQTVEDKTQSFLRDAILRGIYRPGERLRQDQIAEILGVSRMPVRASLRQLEAEGLVSIRPHVGATVSVLAPSEIAELYELRIRLECYLLEHAVPKLTPEVLAELSDLVRRTDEDGDESQADFLDRRRAFYLRLYGLAERPRALEITDRLRIAVGRYLLLQRVDEHPGAHFGLLEHLSAGDVAGAKAWIQTHLSNVSVQLQHLVAQASHEPDEQQSSQPGTEPGTTAE